MCECVFWWVIRILPINPYYVAHTTHCVRISNYAFYEFCISAAFIRVCLCVPTAEMSVLAQHQIVQWGTDAQHSNECPVLFLKEITQPMPGTPFWKLTSPVPSTPSKFDNHQCPVLHQEKTNVYQWPGVSPSFDQSLKPFGGGMPRCIRKMPGCNWIWIDNTFSTNVWVIVSS